mmetsp:Transcript_51328/g.104443  ORF Transcript_51328/g.104443 Transcript_51328/m.104443 type:complete len:1824 (-) Transcript_51328:572-6043(-)|eukprot:CAMPEP_0181347220 /NCGR_PEP_ID=MMETSP1101-20121128/33764_1 /TAXON_ID=46948 /ORGANISM="Rhodomonas abbreviata, Strain Caron Lab Isolate" /LENGTH=1823 /DNA_ID=CAMNT_0023459423 /DNA_START=162 /DNA_END=5633 /DNA_ORIENTATION=+
MIELNAHLPLPADALAKEAESLADRAEQSLASILLQGSTCSVRPYLAFLKLKHKVSYEQLARISRLLFSIFCNAKGDVATEARTAEPLAQVLQALNKQPDCPTPGSESRLQIPWKPIYDALLRVQLRGASWDEYAQRGGDLIIGTESSKQHHQALLSLTRRARNFFAPSAAQEILEELRPFLCPHDKSLYKAAALICKLLPDELESAGGAGAVFTELAGVWQWVTNNPEWQLLWVSLFTRMARHNTPDIMGPLQPLLPSLMSTFLRVLDLPSGKATPQKQEALGWPSDCAFLCDKGDRCREETVKKFTRLLAFTLGPESATMQHLKSTVDYLKPFFHPLQEGGYTKSLDMFQKMMTLNFSKRLAMETGQMTVKKPWMGTYKLTEADRAEFVSLFLPLALTSLSSKDYSMSFGAAQALKDLASISTEEVLPKVMERILSSMDNVMRPHEVQSAISLCGVVVAPVLRSEEGLEFMGQMLQLSLGGIDTNDPMKTMYTLNLFNALLSHMPLADPADLAPGASKPELLFTLHDWISDLLDRVFQLLQNVPPLKKGNPMRSHVQPLLRRFFDLLFCQLSPSLFAAALDKIARKTTEMFYPPAKEFVGYLLDSAVLASPSQALGKLVPLLCRRIVAGGGVMAGSESEVSYFTHILGHTVSRGGDALLAHSAALDEVMGVVSMHEEAAVMKEGQKLLRKTLHGLLGVYPADFRSVAPSQWQWSNVKDFRALCAPPCVPAAAEITFRVPSPASQQRARELVSSWLGQAEAKVSDAATAAPALRVAFGCITACIRGGGALFPPAEMEAAFGAARENAEDEEDEEEDGCVGLLSPVVLEDAKFGAEVRTRLGQLLVAACKRHAVPDNPDVVTLKALLRLVSFFLSTKGAWRKHDALKKACSYNKGVHRFWDQGVGGAYTRRLLQLRAYALLAKRMDMGAFAEDGTVKELLDVVAGMCVHEYSLVRKKAQKVLPVILSRYPLAHARLYSTILQKLKDPKSTKGVVTGAVYTVQKGAVLKRIARHWGLTADLVTGLLASCQFDETKVQVRLAELWKEFVPHHHPLPFGGLAHPHALLQDADVLAAMKGKDVQKEFERGAQRLGQRQQRGKETHQELVRTLRGTMEEGTSASGGNVHWRFAVLAAAALALQVRRDSGLEKATAQQFALALNSDLLPLRQLCRSVVPVLRLSEAMASAADAMDEGGGGGGGGGGDTEMGDASLLSPESFDAPLDAAHAGPFVDATWAGWNKPVQPRRQQAAGASSEFAAAMQEAISQDGWLKGVLDKISQDHRLSGDERAEMSKTASAGMPLASAAVQAAVATRWHWPRSSAAPLSSDFSKDSMQVVEAVVRALGGAAAEAMLKEVGPMVENTSDREQQCAAAEVLAGVLRGSMDWPAAEREALAGKVGPLLSSALGSCPPDSVGVWGEGLRCVASNRDPRRMGWVSRVVAALCESGPDAASSAQVRGLKLLQALLMEQSWKGLPLARALCNASQALLGGSSKSVREEAGRGLVLVARATLPTPRDANGIPTPLSVSPDIAAPSLMADWLPALATQLLTAYTTNPPEVGSPAAVALKNHIEGVLYFFIHASRLGQASSTSAFLRSVVPLMLAVQEDADREFAHVGTIALELVATSLLQPAVAASVLDAAEEVLKSTGSWRVRVAGLHLVRQLAHAVILHPTLRDRAFGIIDGRLGDAMLEVRTAACQCLAGLLRAMPTETVAELLERKPKPKRGRAKASEQSAEDKAAQLVRRHAKVLAVAAAVMSAPTSLPEWMAAAVESLCVLQGEDPVINTTITKTVGDFRKSHQDVWEEVRMTWDEDQLRLVQECSGTQSYYS